MRDVLALFWNITATCFTALMLVFAILGGTFDTHFVVCSFFLCAIISAVQVAWSIFDFGRRSKLPMVANFVVDGLIRCAFTDAIVTVYGAAVGFYEWSWWTPLECLVIVLPVFVVTYVLQAIIFLRTRKQAEDINAKIRSQK